MQAPNRSHGQQSLLAPSEKISDEIVYVSTNFKISNPWKCILAPENSPRFQFSGANR